MKKFKLNFFAVPRIFLNSFFFDFFFRGPHIYFFKDVSFYFVAFCLAPDDCLFIYFTLGRKKKESVWKISTSMVDALKVVRYAIWDFVLGLLGNQ